MPAVNAERLEGEKKHSELVLFSHRLKAMGSPCELRFYAPASEGDALLALALQRLLELEQKYTRYRPDSLTSRINTAAGTGQPIAVDEESARLLDYAGILFAQSDGLFDITSGILRRAWDFRSGRLPAQTEIDPLLPLIGWQKVYWNAPDFYLPNIGMEIDFGGFVKEYATDQLSQLLHNHGVMHGLVNLGGDIRVIGPHPDLSPWIVGIQHPRTAGQAIARIPMMQGAIATSGDYERFMFVNGVRYCHLLNPHTGWPIASRYASASVVADQCVLAGSFSSIALLKSQAEPEWLSESGVTFLLVDQELELQGNLRFQPSGPDQPVR